MAVSKRTRFEVLRRDDFTCRYCRSRENELTIDHVVPVALGGDDTPANLVACCRDCNYGKTSTSPDESTVAQVAEDAVRWAAARRRAAEKLAIHADRHVDTLKWFKSQWGGWDYERNFLPGDWRPSIEQWLDQGLTKAQLGDAHSIALSARHVRSDMVFRYMAGIIKNKLAELDAATMAELRGEDG